MELRLSIGDGVLRINVKPDDRTLWQDTLLTITEPGNVLLACESSSCALEATRLTWVVGAAIRDTSIDQAEAIVNLLQSLGVASNLAEAVPEHCPGLAEEMTWAFYLERHGWLTACPVLPSMASGQSEP
ncbi:hypothetical protein ACLM44_06295 [Synechococcus sp. W2B2]